jgi:hypothetical protein
LQLSNSYVYFWILFLAEPLNVQGTLRKPAMRCRDCRFIDYFTSEAKQWCHQKKDYVNPENSVCEKYKPKIKGPLDKYIW